MKRILCLFGLLGLLGPLAGFGQAPVITWHQVAGGGGSGGAGGVQLAGTIGQAAVAVPAGGGSASLFGGFWNPLVTSPVTPVFGTVSSENPSGYWDPVSFTATLPTDATGWVVITGPGGLAETNPVTAGISVSLPFNGLPRGTNLVVCRYLGDDNYLPATNLLNQVVTNHPPVAAVLTLSRVAGQGLLIPLTELAPTWTDADGDAVRLTVIPLASTNGARIYALNVKTNQDGSYVITNTAYLGYRNAATVDDQLAYAIADGHGGTNVGLINIVVSTSPQFGQASGIVPVSGQAVTLNFLGHPGYRYIVQRSTNLTSWVAVWTTNAPPAGPFYYTDTFADLNGHFPATAYYRLAWSP